MPSEKAGTTLQKVIKLIALAKYRLESMAQPVYKNQGDYFTSDVTNVGFQNNCLEVSTALRAAAGLEVELTEEVEAIETELKELSGVREYKELSEREKTAIAFCATIATEMQKFIRSIEEVLELTRGRDYISNEELKKIGKNVFSTKQGIDEVARHLIVIQDMVAHINKIKAWRQAA